MTLSHTPANQTAPGTATGEAPLPSASFSVDSAISRRISLLRYVLIFVVTFVHIPGWLGADHSPLFLLFSSFIADGVSRTAVPLLTCISGYLLFLSNIDRQPGHLLAAKTRSLLIPMLIWNLTVIVVLYTLQSGNQPIYPFPAYSPFDFKQWMTGVFALTGAPANPPLYFLRDLYVASLLAPLMGLFLRHLPFVGLAALLLLVSQNWDGMLFMRGDIAVNFYVGGLLATKHYKLDKWDAHAGMLFGVFLIVCALVAFYDSQGQLWFKLLTPWLLWPTSALLLGSRFGPGLIQLSRYSFFLFVAHATILRLLWKVYVGYDMQGNYYAWFWLLSPILAAVIVSWLYRILKWRAKPLLNVLLGRRLSRN